jgi:UDPglucose--hexose-1-phosphate uridylyltransferase
MELRKDPITQTWVLQADGEVTPLDAAVCPLCPGREEGSADLYTYPYGSSNWQVRVIPHLNPLYRIEGDAQRRAEGIYDKMRALGAHELVIENPDHQLPLTELSDENVAQVLRAYASRINDLKKDLRFRYITVSRNQGDLAGQDLKHPHSEVTATTFIPRRVGYELRSAQRYFKLKERCIFCDVLQQELMQDTRTVDWDDLFVAFCPFASRVPYETWVLPVNHCHSFEEDLINWDVQLRFARFFKSTLRRVTSIAPAYHLVLHTCPNVTAKYERVGNWQTVMEDYHWHFEIMPVIPSKSKSYSLKEVYYNSLAPETAAKELRNAVVATLAR